MPASKSPFRSSGGSIRSINSWHRLKNALNPAGEDSPAGKRGLWAPRVHPYLGHKPSKSLHRMLSPAGNPTMENLSAILGALGRKLKLRISARVVSA